MVVYCICKMLFCFILSGGGAGGSISIECEELDGYGSITVNGGHSNSRGGGGSGGRIAVYYWHSDFNGTMTTVGGKDAWNRKYKSHHFWFTLYIFVIIIIMYVSLFSTVLSCET